MFLGELHGLEVRLDVFPHCPVAAGLVAREVGADRIVNAVAAFEAYSGPCIVVDFGTATTFDAVSAKGEYLGGVICPGPQVSADALVQRLQRQLLVHS